VKRGFEKRKTTRSPGGARKESQMPKKDPGPSAPSERAGNAYNEDFKYEFDLGQLGPKHKWCICTEGWSSSPDP
jgi:hypothetical protein